MQDKFTIIGSGPAAGVRISSRPLYTDASFEDTVPFRIDPNFKFQEEDQPPRIISISCQTGMMVTDDGLAETDMFHLDPQDLPRLQEYYTINY